MSDSFEVEWLTPHQAAAITGLSYRTVLRAIRARNLRAAARPGPTRQRYRFQIHRRDLEAWMQGARARGAA